MVDSVLLKVVRQETNDTGEMVEDTYNVFMAQNLMCYVMII